MTSTETEKEENPTKIHANKRSLFFYDLLVIKLSATASNVVNTNSCIARTAQTVSRALAVRKTAQGDF